MQDPVIDAALAIWPKHSAAETQARSRFIVPNLKEVNWSVPLDGNKAKVLAQNVWKTTHWKLLCMWAGWDLLALSCRYRIWGGKKRRKGKWEEKREGKHYVLRKWAHSVPIRLCLITEDWKNVSSTPVILHIQTASHTHSLTYFYEVKPLPLK